MHTVVAMAKYSKEEGAESPGRPIRQVMTTTQDDRVFGSSVYALSLLSTSDVYDALPDIMSSVARHAEQQTCQNAVASTLRKHKQAVLHALNDKNQE